MDENIYYRMTVRIKVGRVETRTVIVVVEAADGLTFIEC